MSYALTYTANAAQIYSQRNIYIEIYRKNGGGGDGVLKLTGFRVEVQGTERKDDILVAHKATLTFDSDVNDTLTNETFLTDYYDTWKVVCYVGALMVFTGFIEPSEGGYAFKSRPYAIQITCTDGLGLLKNIPLSDINGEDFIGRNSLIKYIAGALAKTNVELPIRTYCNILEGSMNEDSDMFDQAKLHHRTFLKSPNEFISCYEALEKILFGFTLFQWQAQWVISYRGEMFDTFGPQVDYCNYDLNGDFDDLGSDELGPINIGKDEAIQPVNANHLVSWQPANVQVKTNYRYEIPENLVNNQKLQELGDISFPTSGVGYTSYDVIGWSQYHKNVQDDLEEPINNYTPTIRVEYNPYGFELDRYYAVPFDPASSGIYLLQNYIRHDNTDLFVEAGDKMSVNVSWRLNRKLNTSIRFMVIGLYAFNPATASFTWKYLAADGSWAGSAVVGTKVYVAGEFNNSNGSADTTLWQSGGVSDFTIPQSGTLFICLGAKYQGIAQGDVINFKDLDIVYNSFKEGDKKNVVKGDYWKTNQAQNIKDVLEEDTGISDSIRKIFKGALFQESGTFLTNPTWYRKGDPSKTHHYKSLINWTKYQLYYRKFKRISGDFRGTLCVSDNFETPYRLCFHKHFRFVNDFVNRMYLLTGPCTIDYLENQFTATFVEVEGPNRGGNPNGDSRNFNYIF